MHVEGREGHGREDGEGGDPQEDGDHGGRGVVGFGVVLAIRLLLRNPTWMR